MGDGGGWERVSEGPLREGERVHARVGPGRRFVSVLRHAGRLHAFDSVCYHAGGPLGLGDVEEVGGRACVACPWHHYQVALETGDKLYQALVRTPEGKMVPGDWKSVGVRQRVHEAEERPGDGVFVLLRGEGEVTSDGYAFDEACGGRMARGDRTEQLARPRAGRSGPPPQRSGHAFQRSHVALGLNGGDGKMPRERAHHR